MVEQTTPKPHKADGEPDTDRPAAPVPVPVPVPAPASDRIDDADLDQVAGGGDGLNIRIGPLPPVAVN